MDVLYIFVPCCVFISQPSNIIYLHVFAMLCTRDLKKKKKKAQICPCCLHSQRNRKWWWRLSCSITPMNPLQPVLTSHCCILIQRHKSALSSWLKHYTPIFFCKPVRTVQTTNEPQELLPARLCTSAAPFACFWLTAFSAHNLDLK